MNPEQIRMMLQKVETDLAYIEQSQALQQIADLPHTDPGLALIAVTTLDLAVQLKLKFNQALDRNIDAELDGMFQDAA